MTVKKICVLGQGLSGVPLSAVIALKCPEIRVFVVRTDPDAAYQWNCRLIPPSAYIPALNNLIQRCQNKNLFFTAKEAISIKEADIIFITSECKMKSYGEKKDQVVDLSMIEEAAFLIAEHADSNKIVVESSLIPLKTAECVANVLKYNSKPGVEFQVLSNPEYCERGSSLRNFFVPDCVLIGSDNTSKGVAAAEELASVYERWVVREKIVTNKNWTVELSKICASAMVAVGFSSIHAMCILCEEYDADISPLLEIFEKDKNLGSSICEITFNTGKFPFALQNLIYICESNNLSEVADYWRQILEMLNFFKARFFKQLIWTLNKTAWSKRITLLGFAYFRETELTEGSSAVFLCKSFLEENAEISIYDPCVSKEHVIDDMISVGCKVSQESLRKLVSVYDDPYRATYKSEAIIVCSGWPEFAELDFARIFREMEKPAYIFDSALLLPHSELIKIGFKVYCIGKSLKEYYVVHKNNIGCPDGDPNLSE